MAKWCVGIDLGGTFIKFGLLDSQRRPRGVFQLPTPNDRGTEGVVGQMVEGVRTLLGQNGLSADDVLGVGIGAPGPMKMSEGVIIAMPNIPGMDNVPLKGMVSRGLGMQAVLENDANCAAFGEYLCGAGKDAAIMVLLTLGTGVGSGIIIDGRILHGAHEIGGELGHIIVQPDGEPCGCGQRGCLERYCSATYIAKLATDMLNRSNRPSSLRAVLGQKGAIDSRDIVQARNAGDSLAAEVWDRGAYYLAIACVNACRLFDPDEIVLAGGLTLAGGDLMDPLMKHFRSLHWKLSAPKTKIVFSRLGVDAGVIGAAGVAWAAFGGTGMANPK